MSKLDVVKHNYSILKAMSKNTNIPSEICNLFNKNRLPLVVSTFNKLVESLHLGNADLGGRKRENCQLTNLQVFQLLVLMPFFSVVNAFNYSGSVLSRMFGGKKDMLYSFMSQDNIDWRNIIYRITVKLISNVTCRQDYRKSTLPSVLIADDTDLPKSGLHIESIGKIFSHVHQSCILGYKMLALCWSDGRSQFILDASLHGETGKVEGKEQGLTAKQREARYQRKRDEDSCSAKRKNEYFMGKGEKLIEMVKRCIRARIPFDYLLVDSWFTCKGLIKFVCHSHRRFHLPGMAKLGNTKYKTKTYGEISAKALIAKIVKSKSIRYSRRYHCHHASFDATLDGYSVRLFFCRRSKKEGWKVLLTTDMQLDFLRAYEIYAMRWSIEVFFSDSKRVLGLASCSARDFSSQISHVSLVMIRYNLLAMIKRSLDYETIGGLFRDVYAGVKEITVIEKIWNIILEVVVVIAEVLEADSEHILRQVLEKEERLVALRNYAKTA
ncbi:transposase [Alistipes sp.]|uniref:IS4 family transposase n=1 Tax=Alistipes sp. TaxID=1872444 RepID=UPI0025C633A9|nr:transposase [Alistipes sp.]